MFDIPCKKCLVQATCKQRCDEFNEYSFLPPRLKSIGLALVTGAGFSAMAASIREDITFMVVFLVCAILGGLFMTIGIKKETKYYILAEEFMMYESPIFKKHGIKFPMNRRIR